MEEKNRANHYYISLPSQKTEADIIDFEMKMLEQNRIRGLLPAAREYQDTEVKIYFDISGRQNLEQRYAWQKLSGREIRQILHQVADVAAELEEYMLDYNHLNLMPEYMYSMLEPGDLCFCYEPWDSENFAERIRPLALWFLDHMDYREREEVIFSYEFQRFCDENEVSPALLGQFMAGKAVGDGTRSRKELRTRRENGQEDEAAGAVAKSREQPAAGIAVSEEKAKMGDNFLWKEANSDTARKKNNGVKDLLRRIFPAGGRRYPDDSAMEYLRFAEDETEYGRMTVKNREEKSRSRRETARTADVRKTEAGVFDDACPGDGVEEEVLSEKAVLAELVSEGMPALHIRGYPCFLGSDGDFVDCVVADESVSRIHARLFLSDGCVWVEDLHSNAGTFINGDRMTPDEPWALKEQDELKIGKCAYRFRPGREEKKNR